LLNHNSFDKTDSNYIQRPGVRINLRGELIPLVGQNSKSYDWSLYARIQRDIPPKDHCHVETLFKLRNIQYQYSYLNLEGLARYLKNIECYTEYSSRAGVLAILDCFSPRSFFSEQKNRTEIHIVERTGARYSKDVHSPDPTKWHKYSNK